jgi:pectate lyase
LNLKSTSNIIIRNLKFDEMWEWDEASKGNYDGNDWDFIDLGNGGAAYNVWIDHCTFTKAYDGIVDIKAGCYNITLSWCKYIGDDGATNPNSFLRQQFNYLETNSSSYPMYNWLRTHGFSIDDLVIINQGHDKTHLVGSNDLDSGNSSFTITFAHQWFINVWDRNPARLRAGQIHVYNTFFDDTVALAARRLRDTRIAAMSASDQVKLNGSSTTTATYHMGVFLNGSISTEDGAFLIEKSIYQDCLYPLRNNQTDPLNPVYTGKILALDSIYHFDNADGTSIDLRGNSNDTSVFPAKNANGTGIMGPSQAAVKDFSWNTSSWNTSGLPYAYVMDDPANLKSLLSSGAGAGVISWDKTNWLKTTY